MRATVWVFWAEKRVGEKMGGEKNGGGGIGCSWEWRE